jgi:acetylornithine deacetylase/succinyl-diaminopimelate desuccinylase-like protein
MVFHPDHDRAEIGYWIGKPYWGRGYATEAAAAVLSYGFGALNLHRMHAYHYSRNPASGRVLQKIGMSHEGRAPGHIKKWGTHEDCELYGILRADWGEAGHVNLTPQEERLCTLVRSRAGAMLSDLRMQVALATGFNNKGPLDQARFSFTQRLSRLGATIELVPGDPKPDWLFGVQSGGYIPPTAVCRRKPRRSANTPVPILLSGHLDTVHDPAGSFKQLIVAPDGKTATGPGCVDMKGGLIIASVALEILEEAGFDLAWTVIFNSDEETGSYHSESCLRREAKRVHADRGVGLVMEPALPDGGLVTERLGSGLFQIEARGRSAHVGRDFENGVSAVTALADRLVSIARLPQPSRGRIINIGPVQGGTATNVVPDLARALGQCPLPEPEDRRRNRRIARCHGHRQRRAPLRHRATQLQPARQAAHAGRPRPRQPRPRRGRRSGSEAPLRKDRRRVRRQHPPG